VSLRVLARASQGPVSTFLSPDRFQVNPPFHRPIAPTVAVTSVVSNGPAASPAACKAGRRIRRTALIKRLCLALLLVTILLWVFTATNPTLHPLFELGILLALVLWIAAYTDHRQATENPPTMSKR
jgi:hypothetical protein